MSAEQAARGRAIEAHRFRNTLALARIAVATALAGFVLAAALVWATAAHDDRRLASSYLRTEATQRLRATISIRPQPVPEDGFGPVEAPDHAAAMRLLRRMGLVGGLAAILIATSFTTLQRRRWLAIAEAAAMDQVLRGARIATPQQLLSLLAWVRKQGGHPITIGGVPLPPADETRHMLAVGRTGSGKTTFLRGLVRQIAERGESAVIYDPDGSYVSLFYRPERGDVILNVWDLRSARWNPLDDLATLADAQRVAAVLLPKPSGAPESAIWYDQARLLLAHVLDHLASTGGSLDDLAALLNGDDGDEQNERLRAIVAGTPAARIFTAGGERATASVLFMTSMAARTVATLAAVSAAAETFSFDRFYAALDERPGPAPFIFLACPRRYREAGTPVVTAWLDAAASAIIQREPDRGVNAWMILDELATLPPVQSLNSLLPEARKYRACVTFACQSIAQLHERYGEAATHTLTGQTATQLLMAVGDPLTAKWGVDLIGSTEVEAVRPTATLDSEAKGDKGSLAATRERKALVLDSELTGLAIGEAYLRLSGLPVARIRIAAPPPEPAVAPAFVPAPAAIRKAAEVPAAPMASVRIEDGDDWLPPMGPA